MKLLGIQNVPHVFALNREISLFFILLFLGELLLEEDRLAVGGNCLQFTSLPQNSSM